MSDETNEAILTPEKWAELSDADRVLLKSLGIFPEEAKPPKQPKTKNEITEARRLATRTTCPEPYYLEVTNVCACCGTHSTHTSKMDKRKETDNFLSIIYTEIPDGEEYQVLRTRSTTCVACYDILFAIPHDKLVERFIKLTNKFATR